MQQPRKRKNSLHLRRTPATSRDNFHLINACTENPAVDPSTLASVHCMDLYFPIRAQLRCMAKNCESFKPFLPNCSCNFIPSVTERTLTAFSCKYHREISSSARQTHFHHTRTFSVIFRVLLISKLLFEQTRQTEFHSLPQARIFAPLVLLSLLSLRQPFDFISHSLQSN